MNKLFRMVSLSLALLLALTALPVLAEGITLTDMAGREVSLPAPARKIVVLAAADAEILYAIGAGDRVVGRGEYANYPEAVLVVPAVQSGNETNIEQIIALAPDLVVMPTMAQQVEQVEQMEKAGIPVLATDAKDIAGTYAAIRLLGEATGLVQEADAVVRSMEEGFAALKALAAEQELEGSVYFEVSPLQWGLWTAGKGTFMDEIAALLGLTNAFEDVDGWKEVSQEQVLARDPDYIVTVAMYFGEGPTPVEEITGRDGWQDLKAVKEQHVLLLDNDQISRPGPRLLDAAESLYQLVTQSSPTQEAPAA